MSGGLARALVRQAPAEAEVRPVLASALQAWAVLLEVSAAAQEQMRASVEPGQTAPRPVAVPESTPALGEAAAPVAARPAAVAESTPALAEAAAPVEWMPVLGGEAEQRAVEPAEW